MFLSLERCAEARNGVADMITVLESVEGRWRVGNFAEGARPVF